MATRQQKARANTYREAKASINQQVLESGQIVAYQHYTESSKLLAGIEHGIRP
jgi:hypothetical protein